MRYGHLDDALAITLTVAAVAALVRDRPWSATVLIAAAGASKPWALPFALVLLAHPTDRARRAAVFAGLSALAWVPFLVADRRTLGVGSFTIINAPDSALRALGIDAATTPSWDRPAQLLLAAVLGLWCLRTGRALAIPAVALAARLLLDPGTYPYYTASLVLAVLCIDLLRERARSIPWLTLMVTTWFAVTNTLVAVAPESPGAVGGLRAVFLIALIGHLVSADVRLARVRPQISPVRHAFG